MYIYIYITVCFVFVGKDSPHNLVEEPYIAECCEWTWFMSLIYVISLGIYSYKTLASTVTHLQVLYRTITRTWLHKREYEILLYVKWVIYYIALCDVRG
jgi:hypothetical protein